MLLLQKLDPSQKLEAKTLLNEAQENPNMKLSQDIKEGERNGIIAACSNISDRMEIFKWYYY